MRKIALLIVFVCFCFVSCTTSKPAVKTTSLEGTWELKYITGPKIAFDGLFPNKKPTIAFDLKQNRIKGDNSCNQYFGALLMDGAKINFKDAKIVTTMMACEGNGDSVYMDTLNKIESYTITDDGKTLNFLLGNVVMMRFTHQE
ncbi:META domain-containing protein [Flavobacterium aquariorum]|uniref:META domain-containing protein n=1 Tax=Flavobacterium aquariorum TaxID=2217670 RepID=A0A2W7UGY4_9FLAO|nr:META domain-containing protein [Flavobacterium aquariorum]PZX94447.1 META domain-containing protein [Flavobacterium aquariorum]